MPSWIGFLGTDFPLYSLPSIFALTTKLLIFWLARHSLKAISPWIIGLMVSLFGLNTFELTLFLYTEDPQQALPMLIGFYLFAAGSAISFLAVCLEISGHINLWTRGLLGIIAALCAIALIVPGASIAGAESIGYSVTRIAGSWYWVIQICMAGTLLAGVGSLIYSIITYTNWETSRRALVMLIAFTPNVIVVLTVLVSMHYGLEINATVMLSSSISLFLAIMLYTEHQHRLFLFLSHVPNTKERASKVNAGKLTLNPGIESLETQRKKFEQILITNAVKSTNGNISQAAELLQISRSTMKRKMGLRI